MKVTKVTLAESNSSLLPDLWRDSLHITCGLTACTPGSAPGPTLGNEYGKTLPFLPFGTCSSRFAAPEIWVLSVQVQMCTYPDIFHCHSRSTISGRPYNSLITFLAGLFCIDYKTAANMALQLHINVSLNRPPERTWRRPPGRPQNKWLDQLRNDSTRPTGDLWRRAVDRGHGGATTRRPSPATRP